MTKISTHLYPSPIAVPADARDMLDLRSIGITAPLFAVTYTHSVPACWTDFLAGWRVCGQLTHSGGLAGVMRSILVPRCKGTAYTLAVFRRDGDRLLLVTRIRDGVDIGATGHEQVDSLCREGVAA